MDLCLAAALQPRVFVGHSIYKGKAALTVEPKAPEFTPLDVCLILFIVGSSVSVLWQLMALETVLYHSENLNEWFSFCLLQSGAFKVSKEGFVLLQFAPAAGVRQYDWGRKQVISNLGLLLFNYSMKMWFKRWAKIPIRSYLQTMKL